MLKQVCVELPELIIFKSSKPARLKTNTLDLALGAYII
jgi:hypothetical protein